MGRLVTHMLRLAGVFLVLTSFSFAQGPPSGVGPPPHAGPGQGKNMQKSDRGHPVPGEQSGARPKVHGRGEQESSETESRSDQRPGGTDRHEREAGRSDGLQQRRPNTKRPGSHQQKSSSRNQPEGRKQAPGSTRNATAPGDGLRYQRIERSGEDLRRRAEKRQLRSSDRRIPTDRIRRRYGKPDDQQRLRSPRLHPGKGGRGKGLPAHARRHIPSFAPVPGTGWQPKPRGGRLQGQRRAGQPLDERTRRDDGNWNPEVRRSAPHEQEDRQQPGHEREEHQLPEDERDRSDERPEQERE